MQVVRFAYQCILIILLFQFESSYTLNFDNNKFESILKEVDIDSETLIVTFGGLGQNFVMPMYEFYTILKPFHVKKIFVRDRYQAWYQHGISDDGNITKTCKILEREIVNTKAKRVVFFGNSSGGFAALLFGRLLHVDEVHAFVPYAYTGNRVEGYAYREPQYFDLPFVFLNIANSKTQFHIHYSDDDAEDVKRAKAIEGDNVIHHEYHNKGGHIMVKKLREEGILVKIIKKAISY